MTAKEKSLQTFLRKRKIKNVGKDFKGNVQRKHVHLHILKIRIG